MCPDRVAIADLRLGSDADANLEKTTIADAKMVLRQLIEQEADAELVRETLAFAAERMMERKIGAETGVPSGVRSPNRLNQRNRYRDRNWYTPTGRIELVVQS